MQLYFSPGACSLSPHIVLLEAGLPFELKKVDTRTHKTESGDDYYQINPKGYVPAMKLDGGDMLTEGPAIVQWIADQKPAAGLAPPNGSIERYHLQEWLNFISTEIHKQYSPLFSKTTTDEVRAAQREKIGGRLDMLNKQLDGKQYLMGAAFSVADAYLFTVLRWSAFTGIDLSKWPVVKAYWDRIAARPKVQEALKAEGIT